MRKATSQDIEKIREKIFEQHPNKSVSNFGFIYVEDRWIMGLILNGIRYVGEANTPQDAHSALQVDLERGTKGEDDGSNIDPNRADSTVPSN